jgi:DNA-binding MarR family transcriptional regulator
MVEKADYIRLASFRTAMRHFLRFSESKARTAGLTPQQHQMLLAIQGTPDRDWATPGEIAESLQVHHNAAVSLVTRGETAGLVARSSHPDDQRKVCVTVTEKGLALLAALSEEHKAELERFAYLFTDLFQS